MCSDDHDFSNHFLSFLLTNYLATMNGQGRRNVSLWSFCANKFFFLIIKCTFEFWKHLEVLLTYVLLSSKEAKVYTVFE